MDSLDNGEPPPDHQQEPEDIANTFASLIFAMGPPKNRPSITKFVKRLDDISKISLPPTLPRRATLSLAERGLVGQFTGLWPSPKSVHKWVERNWTLSINGKMSIRFCGRGYYTFHFETK